MKPRLEALPPPCPVLPVSPLEDEALCPPLPPLVSPLVWPVLVAEVVVELALSEELHATRMRGVSARAARAW